MLLLTSTGCHHGTYLTCHLFGQRLFSSLHIIPALQVYPIARALSEIAPQAQGKLRRYREIDFIIIKENRVEELIEAKWSDDKISKSLLYYAERLKPEKATQITAHLRRPYSQGRIRVTDLLSYFRLDFFTSADAVKINS